MSFHREFSHALRWFSMGGMGCLLLFPAISWGQLPQNRLYAVFPAGGQVGTTFDVNVTSSADSEELSELVFDHPGLKAVAKTRDENGQMVPIPNQFSVTVAADVPPGLYEIRSRGLYGLSNPRTFAVGATPEIQETEPNQFSDQAQEATPGTIINGKINGGADVDWFKFSGQAGQTFVAQIWGKRLDSRLDGTIELFAPSGQRLAIARNTVRQDPLLIQTLPSDGEYRLKVYDFVYAGGEEYFYRLDLNQRPFIESIQPAAAVPGSTQTFTLYGRNLPGGQDAGIASRHGPLQKLDVSVAVPADAASLDLSRPLHPESSIEDGFQYTLDSPAGRSNAIFIPFAHGVPTVEVEPNDVAANAMALTLPAEVSGLLQTRRDADVFRFPAKAGEVYWIDVTAHRLGSDADPYLLIDQVVVNDKQEETLKRIAAVDDDGVNPLPFVYDTLSDDPVYRLAVPADGVYQLTVRDRYAASRGDPSLRYHLSVRPAAPDFRLVSVPSQPVAAGQKLGATWALGLRRGDQDSVNVVVLRRDGLDTVIQISAEGLPPGVTCKPIQLGPQQNSGILVFESAEDAPAWSGQIQIVGRTTLEDPALVAAVNAASAAVTAATAEVAKAAMAVTAADQIAQVAKTAAEAAAKASADQPDNEDLKKAVADTEAAKKTADDAAVAAREAHKANEQKLAEANAALAAAQTAQTAGRKELVRPSRYGTVVWSAPVNQPGQARLASHLGLSVIEEPAPFVLKTPVHEIVANHNTQILVPLALTRRNDFAEAVTATFVGQPQNVQVENKPIPKEATSEVYRIFVPANAPVGTYELHLIGQAAVSYRRNPQKADRLKAVFDASDAALKAAMAKAAEAVTARDEAKKTLATAQADAKTMVEAKTKAEQAVKDAEAAEAKAKEALEKVGDNADEKAAAEKALADAQAAVVAAKDALTKATEAATVAETNSKNAEQAVAAAEAAVKATDDAQKAAMAARAAAEKAFQDADKAAKAQSINAFPPSTPIVLTIKNAPYTLPVEVPNGGAVKVGESISVKVTVKRQNNFAGPATLTLELPPGATGLTADPVTIPADQSEGQLVIRAAADAPEGEIKNAVIRVKSEFDGPAAVDAPIPLKITK